MTEETQSTEMVEQEQPAAASAVIAPDPVTELEQIRAALKKANGEAAKYRKAAELAEAERKAKQEAEMTELDKANKRADEAEAKALKLEREAMQREIAAKVGLPAKLANRLQGETPEEMEADALAILEDLPKPPPKTPGIVPTNPGTNGSTGETDEQRRARLGLR